MSEKHIKAVAAYYSAQQEVKRLGNEIGDALNRCFDAYMKENSEGFMQFHNYKNHLEAAYTLEPGEDGEAHYTNGKPDEYLAATCQHCHAAHRLIQDRKVARKKFGAAKRWISLLGRAATETPHTEGNNDGQCQ